VKMPNGQWQCVASHVSSVKKMWLKGEARNRSGRLFMDGGPFYFWEHGGDPNDWVWVGWYLM